MFWKNIQTWERLQRNPYFIETTQAHIWIYQEMSKVEGYKSKHKIRYTKKEWKWKNMIWAEIPMRSDFSLLILRFQRERGVLLPTSHSRWHSLCGVCVLQEGCTGQPHAPLARRRPVQTSQNGKPLLRSQSLVLQVVRVCPFYRHYLHSVFLILFFCTLV